MNAIVDSRTPDPKKFIKGATGDWEIIIGLEIHAQLATASKIFSGASTKYGAAPIIEAGRRVPPAMPAPGVPSVMTPVVPATPATPVPGAPAADASQPVPADVSAPATPPRASRRAGKP